MRAHRSLFAITLLFVLTSCSRVTTPPAAEQKPAAPAAQIHGNVLQVMRGILFPNSNVIFAVQGKNPAEMKPADPKADPSTATDPLVSTYGGWQAVENAGIAMAESANLLIIPGRKCSNGKPAPIDSPEWKKAVDELRAAGMKTYEAGKSKNDDKVLEASDAVAAACASCHDKYREKPTEAQRCM